MYTSFHIFRKVIIINLLKRYALGSKWVKDKWKSNVGRITCVVKFFLNMS